jgi:hypothetical protein
VRGTWTLIQLDKQLLHPMQRSDGGQPDPAAEGLMKVDTW